ncbi:MAG: hypothetical protein K5651_01840 [Bacteroidales bacterium]|nr:hypothetical protein [Bacteroidales bacterium]
MRLIRHDKRCEYLMVDITPEELAVLSAAVQLFGEQVCNRFGKNCTKTRQTVDQVRESFLADNTIKI